MSSIEIIRRDSENTITKDTGETAMFITKDQIAGENVQVSYNSYGHIVIRLICSDGESDRLVVFDKAASSEIVRFFERLFNMSRYNGHNDGIPF